MERDIVTYRGFNFYRYPNAKTASERRYYSGRCKINGKWEKVRLHRYKWMCERGEIPKGFHIHHIDHNTLNNDIENLQCLSSKEHQRETYNSLSEEEKKIKTEILLTKAQAKAKEWHKSEAGREWHKAHAAKTLLRSSANTCLCCGIGFNGNSIAHVKFCSQKCSNKYSAREFRKARKAQLTV